MVAERWLSGAVPSPHSMRTCFGSKGSGVRISPLLPTISPQMKAPADGLSPLFCRHLAIRTQGDPGKIAASHVIVFDWIIGILLAALLLSLLLTCVGVP